MSSPPPVVLVSGAAGFVGSNLVRRLKALGEIVVGGDAFRHGRTAASGFLEPADVPMLDADPANPQACAAAGPRTRG